MMYVILPWAHNPFILYEILKRTLCGDQSTVDQKILLIYAQLFITESFLICPARYAIC